jgi:inner membrane protein
LLPPSHIAYTWITLSLAQDVLDIDPDADYRLVALAAIAPDLIDKPLAWAYFYRKYKAAVLFAHTLLFNAIVLWVALRRFPVALTYVLALVGHSGLDRLWLFPDTFFWPLRGWRFHVWQRSGEDRGKLRRAYLHTFTTRPGLWLWELGGLLALAWFVRKHRLYRPENLLWFAISGKPPR